MGRVARSAVVVAVLLAGACSSASHHAAPRDSTSSTPTSTATTHRLRTIHSQPSPYLASVAFGTHTIWVLGVWAPCPSGPQACARLWRSQDGGQHWIRTAYLQRGSGTEAQAQVVADDTNVLVAFDGTVQESRDAGAHFHTALRRTGAQVALVGSEVWVMSACPVDERPRCVASLDTRALAGGAWKQVAIPQGHWTDLHATNARHVQLMSIGSAAITLDGGRTWRAERLPCKDVHQADMTLPSTGAGYVECRGPGAGSMAYDFIYRTLDDGEHWTKVHDTWVDGVPGHIAIDNAGDPVLLGDRMAALVSPDGGHTWRAAAPPGNEAGAGFGELLDTGNAFAEAGATNRRPPAFAWSTDLRHWTITRLPFDNP